MWSFILALHFHLNLCFPNSTFPFRFSESESVFIGKHPFQNSLHQSPPIPVAARSKAWFCGRSLAGIAGSNPAGVMDVCLL